MMISYGYFIKIRKMDMKCKSQLPLSFGSFFLFSI